jgi:hypothetical protein
MMFREERRISGWCGVETQKHDIDLICRARGTASFFSVRLLGAARKPFALHTVCFFDLIVL